MPTNLLFITTDQQRWDSLPCYGLDFIQTPAIDRLAAEGTVFENCIVPAPVCVPCRASLLSGQYPTTTGVLSNLHWLAEGTPIWSSLLGQADRRTAAIGKMHFYPWDELGGFQERITAEDKRHIYLPDDHVKFLQSNGMERFHPVDKPGYFEHLGASVTPRPERFHIDAFVGDQAASWIENSGDDPFAVWVSFPGPHDPYDPPEDMADMYYDAPIPEPIGSPEELANKPPAQRGRNKSSVNSSMYRIDLSTATSDHYRRWRAHYYANITLIDRGIGKIIAALESRNILDETLIVFTSDHGDALGDHGLSYKSFFYESMVHVPLIIRGPGAPVNERCGSLVSSIDLVPLFYRTCGVEPPDTLQGEDISVLLENTNGILRDRVFCENMGRSMVQTSSYKYAHYDDGSAELYDLEDDPDEIINFAGEPDYKDVAGHMKSLLLEHTLNNARYHARAVSRPQNPLRIALEKEFSKKRDS